MPYRFKIVMLCIIFAGLSYLLGSINFAILCTKKSTGKDIRDMGSGNAGMTNVMRSAGVLPGIITLIGDFGKAAVAVLLGKYVLTAMLINLAPASVVDPMLNYDFSNALAPIYGGTICGMFCIIGHCFPVFYGYKGGKGVSTCIGMITVLDWKIAVILFVIFAIVFLCTRIVSLSSCLAAICYPIVSFLMYNENHSLLPVAEYITKANQTEWKPFLMNLVWFEVIAALVFCLIILINHRTNIIRLIHGEEKKLSFKKKKSQ